MTRYYLDTSIWLDLFENRNEPNLPKGIFAKKFMELMITAEEELIYSDIVDIELKRQGYSQDELYYLMSDFEKILIRIEATKKQASRARELSNRRSIPFLDALHAVLAKDNKAVIITRDKHFQILSDLAESRKPEEIT